MASDENQSGADLLDSEVKKLQDQQGAAPSKQLPGHEFHVRHGANMLDVGYLRPMFYSLTGESPDEAIVREALHVRNEVGVFESSTLGKFEIAGADAATFLNRVYSTNIDSLEVGMGRYCLAADESGIFIDDGICVRIDENCFLAHTTSVGAASVGEWFERWRTEWPDLDVQISDVTTQWALLVVSGPKVRHVMEAVDSDVDFSDEAFPPMAYREGTLGGFPVRLLRAGFTGERGFEVSVRAQHGEAMLDAIYEAGRAFNISPFGIGALNFLRIEKGFLLPGFDTDNETTPADLGWGTVLARKETFFVGKQAMELPPRKGDGRLKLVNLRACNSEGVITQGGQIAMTPKSSESIEFEGRVTSACTSPTLGCSVGLGLVRDGYDRIGEEVYVHTDEANSPVAVVICGEAHYDPKRERIRG